MTSAERATDLTSCRVLVVEDEFFLAEDMAQALRALGAEVVGPVSTSDAALALLAAEPVHAAVLDVNLKGQMAYSIADALRDKGVPFVFATGYSEAAMPEAYRDVPRWEKPFNAEDLASSLAGLLRA
ncbi:MAG TPA: response regulator [Mesorhizobium sp.]|jgi:CheY-like chemotaxis protein|nr:response regulator [Mesorhizobium sp.]